ncbi:hypothetical protein [Bradyrhizobium sp. LHD-71]|uniref:hypothetical protein n=1 Tax=Bradyrhizobium sp. LHD-71 TaxID=3072141 RepID=UPI00280CCF5C|nr:hypothetical protein [Bradyrhizobium sp. LHD-71]MDQ8731645.1 hypothetical protein [Bradyrhizobium sp. LHD-71]
MGSTVERNPFGVMDVPDPYDAAVIEFAAKTSLDGESDDDNATSWISRGQHPSFATIEGHWESRWNGGADPTIPGDSADKWKQGAGELKIVRDHVYLRFDWHIGARKGLIEARRDGARRLVGKYINLTDPKITRPWIGLIVSNDRIDGCFPEGRLDFRR